jgi:mRNA interferase YafQ
VKIKRHKQFIKDFKKVQLTDGQFAKLIQFINCLIDNMSLPRESRDHVLNGEYSDCREFHIGGDTLVIYLVTETDITLLRMGSHSQLFKSM